MGMGPSPDLPSPNGLQQTNKREQHPLSARPRRRCSRDGAGYGERKRNFVGQHFWARGYFVSTVGRDEAVIREYIRNQEQEDKRLEQMNLWR
jgi:REP element-mobilizing transposase RayT